MASVTVCLGRVCRVYLELIAPLKGLNSESIFVYSSDTVSTPALIYHYLTLLMFCFLILFLSVARWVCSILTRRRMNNLCPVLEVGVTNQTRDKPNSGLAVDGERHVPRVVQAVSGLT